MIFQGLADSLKKQFFGSVQKFKLLFQYGMFEVPLLENLVPGTWQYALRPKTCKYSLGLASINFMVF